MKYEIEICLKKKKRDQNQSMLTIKTCDLDQETKTDHIEGRP